MTDLTPAVVVDLDGTYVDGNTLWMYIKCGLSDCLRRGHVFKTAYIIATLAARRLRLMSHTAMKSKVLTDLGKEQSFMAEFVAKVGRHIDKDVATLIDRSRHKGHKVLLATAAPDFYVKEIWQGDFVATADCCSITQIECRGDEKLRRVKEWLAKNACQLHMVVTDHMDDAPLVEYNKEGINVLVRPDKNSLSFFRKLKPAHLFFIEEIDKFGITC